MLLVKQKLSRKTAEAQSGVSEKCNLFVTTLLAVSRKITKGQASRLRRFYKYFT